jgi:hypothetical protein
VPVARCSPLLYFVKIKAKRPYDTSIVIYRHLNIPTAYYVKFLFIKHEEIRVSGSIPPYSHSFLTSTLESGECSMEVRLTSNLLMDIRLNFIKSPISIETHGNFSLTCQCYLYLCKYYGTGDCAFTRFDPDRSRWIFSDVKKSSACLPSEGK